MEYFTDLSGCTVLNYKRITYNKFERNTRQQK